MPEVAVLHWHCTELRAEIINSIVLQSNTESMVLVFLRQHSLIFLCHEEPDQGTQIFLQGALGRTAR